MHPAVAQFIRQKLLEQKQNPNQKISVRPKPDLQQYHGTMKYLSFKKDTLYRHGIYEKIEVGEPFTDCEAEYNEENGTWKYYKITLYDISDDDFEELLRYVDDTIDGSNTRNKFRSPFADEETRFSTSEKVVNKTIPAQLEDILKEDATSAALRQWSSWMKTLSVVAATVVAVVMSISTLALCATYTGEAMIAVGIFFGGIVATVVSVLVILGVFRAITLLLDALRSIVMHTRITAETALLEIAKTQDSTTEQE